MQIVRHALPALLATILAAPLAAQALFEPPTAGWVVLRSGFSPDPRVVAVRAGGFVQASLRTPACSGFVAHQPDVKLTFSAGTLPLILSVAAAGDTILVVHDPRDNWRCDDDGGVRGLNPMLRFDTPASGDYDIWIGTKINARALPARLHISEHSSQ